MKIFRKGANADHGTRSVELKVSKMVWNQAAEAFDITFAGAATDFATPSRHIYRLRFTPKELAAQLAMLVEAGSAMESEDFTATFQKALPSLFKLQAMASGLKIAA